MENEKRVHECASASVDISSRVHQQPSAKITERKE
jgi:hypothetical protein